MNFRSYIAVVVALLAAVRAVPAQTVIQFVVTSDLHYGIARPSFRGDSGVDARVVNAAQVAQMNTLPGLRLPSDSGVHASQRVGPIDFVAVTGDIANREENGIQSAADSWRQFEHEYLTGLTLRDRANQAARIFVVPGNHDLSNAIGFTKPMTPARDATSMAGIFNLTLRPAQPVSPTNFDPRRDVVHTSYSIGGVHLAFLSIWPDSAERVWLAHDIDTVATTTPVVIFVHDPPIGDAKHFTNPRSPHDINPVDRFENLILEAYKDTASSQDSGSADAQMKATTAIEQRDLSDFLEAHPNVKAYFHGHSNANEYYIWHGPSRRVNLNTFRVDSPMKGAASATDETRLSFQLVTIDTSSLLMTVRECLWNAAPGAPVRFGATRTVSLR